MTKTSFAYYIFYRNNVEKIGFFSKVDPEVDPLGKRRKMGEKREEENYKGEELRQNLILKGENIYIFSPNLYGSWGKNIILKKGGGAKKRCFGKIYTPLMKLIRNTAQKGTINVT